MFQIAQIITVMSVPEGSRDIKNSLQKLSCRYFSIYHTHHPLLRRSMAYERSIPPRDSSPIIPSIYYMSIVKMCGHSRSTGVSMLSIKRWLVHHLRGRCIVVIRVVWRPLGTTIATGRCYNIPIASIYYWQHSDAVLYVVAVLWRRTIVIIRTGLLGGGGSNSLCDCSPVVDSTTWRLVHDRIINYYSIDMSCRVLDVVSHAKQTRRGLLY